MHVLDNPVWHSLTTAQRGFALGTGAARRYHADVAPFVAIERPAPEAHAAALALVVPDETINFVGVAPTDWSGWQLLHESHIVQMAWDGRSPDPVRRDRVVELTRDDAAEMLALTELAFPDYFRRRTVELGRYYGVKHGNMLIAMAGERMQGIGVREVSAVCTHPDHLGRGFAALLSTVVIEGMLARGEQPFLHVGERNSRARALYERLGFVATRELGLWRVRRV